MHLHAVVKTGAGEALNGGETLVPLLPAQRVPLCDLCHNLSFLSGLICSSVQGKGERSLGGATLTTLGNLPAMCGHRGKPRNKTKQKK